MLFERFVLGDRGAGKKRNPNAVIAERLRIILRFILFLPDP